MGDLRKVHLFQHSFMNTVVPPNTADLGTDEKAAVFGNRRYWESYNNLKKPYLELGNGRRYWGEAVLGGAVLGGGGGRLYVCSFQAVRCCIYCMVL